MPMNHPPISNRGTAAMWAAATAVLAASVAVVIGTGPRRRRAVGQLTDSECQNRYTGTGAGAAANESRGPNGVAAASELAG
jgi:hypothetical protein